MTDSRSPRSHHPIVVAPVIDVSSEHERVAAPIVVAPRGPANLPLPSASKTIIGMPLSERRPTSHELAAASRPLPALPTPLPSPKHTCIGIGPVPVRELEGEVEVDNGLYGGDPSRLNSAERVFMGLDERPTPKRERRKRPSLWRRLRSWLPRRGIAWFAGSLAVAATTGVATSLPW